MVAEERSHQRFAEVGVGGGDRREVLGCGLTLGRASVGVGGDDEAGGHRQAGGHQLAEVGALTTGQGDVGGAHAIERNRAHVSMQALDARPVTGQEPVRSTPAPVEPARPWLRCEDSRPSTRGDADGDT